MPRSAAVVTDLLFELQAAHLIIRNALAVMTTEQKAKWGRLNERDEVDGEGITRANERAAAIAKNGGGMAGTIRVSEEALEAEQNQPNHENWGPSHHFLL